MIFLKIQKRASRALFYFIRNPDDARLSIDKTGSSHPLCILVFRSRAIQNQLFRKELAAAMLSSGVSAYIYLLFMVMFLYLFIAIYIIVYI